jgi:nucleoprotein TPR
LAEKKHQELLEKIEQANLLRESNITLRDQLEVSIKKQVELENQLRIAKEELIPLKGRIIKS